MADQPQVGRIEQLSDKPATKASIARVRKRIEAIKHTPDIDLLDGMLQQQADEIKRLKAELQKKFRELMPSTVERIVELEETLREIEKIALYVPDCDAGQMADALNDIRNKCFRELRGE